MKVSNFKLGLFIITGIALLTILVVMFGAGVFSPKGLIIETYIDGSVQGLDVGSPLKYRGVSIGKVDEIALVEHYYDVEDPDLERYVLVRMEIQPSPKRRNNVDLRKRLSNWVDEGMRLRLASQGITGIAYMEADFVDPDFDEDLEISWEPEVPYIPSTRSQLTRIADSIEAISRDLENAEIPKIAADVNKLVNTVERAVEDADVEVISNQVQASLGRIENMAKELETIVAEVKDKEATAKAIDTLDDINRTVNDVQGSVAQVSQELTSAIDEAHAAITDVRGYIESPDMDNTVTRIDTITLRLESTLTRIENSYARKDQEVDLILSDIRAISASLRDMTELISQYPSLTVLGEPPTPAEVYQND